MDFCSRTFDNVLSYSLIIFFGYRMKENINEGSRFPDLISTGYFYSCFLVLFCKSLKIGYKIFEATTINIKPLNYSGGRNNRNPDGRRRTWRTFTLFLNFVCTILCSLIEVLFMYCSLLKMRIRKKVLFLDYYKTQHFQHKFWLV